MYGLGIDIGSTASKAVIVNERRETVGSSVCALGAGTSGVDQALSALFEQTSLAWDDIAYSVATGYGRQRFNRADKQVSEISCHAKGVSLLLPGVRTIIDIGGQDAKALRLRADGALDEFIMNEKCAAGTGRFLDVMARVVESDVSLLSELDGQADLPVEISSTCTVFAESEVISRLAEGEPIPNIVAGRLGPVEGPVAMSGGVARNQGAVRALENELGVAIEIPDSCQLSGALGAALFAIEALGKGRIRSVAAGPVAGREAGGLYDVRY